MRRASSASSSRPDIRMYRALPLPTRLTRPYISRWPMVMPRRATGMPRRLPSAAMRRSVATASSQPPPAAKPRIMDMTGVPISATVSSSPSTAALYTRPLVESLRCCSKSLMSAPAEKASSPAPAITTQRTSRSLSRSRSSVVSSTHMSSEMALRWAGRLMVTVATGGSRRTRMYPLASTGVSSAGVCTAVSVMRGRSCVWSNCNGAKKRIGAGVCKSTTAPAFPVTSRRLIAVRSLLLLHSFNR